MEYRPFGQTGMQVSAIGVGCWEIGGGYGSIEETQFIQAVHRALDLGINCFDTAEGVWFRRLGPMPGEAPRKSPQGSTLRDEVRHRLKRSADLPWQDPPACHGPNRESPQELQTALR